MNKTFAFSFSGTIAAIALLAATPLRAQTLPPTVVIHASDVSASEAGGGTNTGTFLIQRNFASSNSLVVFYSVSGTVGQPDASLTPHAHTHPATRPGFPVTRA